jgi:hypothetical protein
MIMPTRLVWMLAPAFVLGFDPSQFPEFDKLTRGDLDVGAQADDADRGARQNICSMCEAAAHQASVALWRLKRDRDRGVNSRDANEALEELCSAQSKVWKEQYSVLPRGSVGLLAGPGTSISGGKASGGRSLAEVGSDDPDHGYYEGVEFRLRESCTETLLGGDLEEEDLYEIVVKAEQKRKKQRRAERAGSATEVPSAGREALFKTLCDAKRAPCGRYWTQYGGKRRPLEDLSTAKEEL